MKLSEIILVIYGTSLAWFWWFLLPFGDVDSEIIWENLMGTKTIWGSITAGWFVWLGWYIYKRRKNIKPDNQ